MRALRVVNVTRGRPLAERAFLADGWWTRLRGLVGRPRLEDGEGLVIEPCRGVHMYGMTYPIDVAMVADDGEIVAVYRDLAPNARTGWHAEARWALELPAGVLAQTGTRSGDRIEWSETGSDVSAEAVGS